MKCTQTNISLFYEFENLIHKLYWIVPNVATIFIY